MPIVGFRRATSGGACAFCAMLASRGAVYSRRSVDFPAHDGCSCSPEPVWSREEEPPEVLALRRLWDESTAGLSGKDALRAFRRAYEGRSAKTSAAVVDDLEAARKRFADRLPAAGRGEDALLQAPIRLHLGGPTTGLDEVEEWTTERRQSIGDALEAYRGNAYEDVNAVLRQLAGDNERLASTTHIRGLVERIDEALKFSRLTRDVEVFRGVGDGRKLVADPTLWDGPLDGMEFRSWAYASTSASRETADEFTFGGNKPLVMKILVPHGVPGIQISGEEYESEVLLPRGLRFRVVNDHGTVDGTRMLDVEVIPDD